METKKIYFWKLEKTEYGMTEVVNWGIVTSFIEIFVDRIIPECGSSADRNLDQMQDYIDEHYADKGYTFKWEDLTINLETAFVTIDTDGLEDTTEERVGFLEAAQRHLKESIGLIRLAVHDTEEQDVAESYILPHLENWAEGNNQFDRTAIPRLIEALQKEAEGGKQ